ncbi:hypothetical protein KFZ56_17350 [Virgibacillus sp. NKC19-3]|uniref:hypothetical protein n=1 Tax=Virgibacillus saliphilus TaxID=2831674 RepID=UPI001C9AFB09|nr:hypothetical protein [Virgibacillus sp. NKC19-3]MBY7144788.1 hypothetical protein [Virgibacillus sp. NKC19-3]
MVNQSPNGENKIEFYKVAEFPDPTLKIKYGNRYINKLNVLPNPDNISVEWKNDKEANVLLNENGREPDIEKIEFK